MRNTNSHYRVTGLVVICLLFLSSLIVVSAQLTASKLDSVYAPESSHILTGEVISLESRWINTSKQSLIWSDAVIEVEKHHKTPGRKENFVTITFPSGKVRGITQITEVDPGGTLMCYLGQKIKIFCIEDNRFREKLYPLQIIQLTKPNATQGQRSGITLIEEEQKLFFEYSLDQHMDEERQPHLYSINENTDDCEGEGAAVQSAFATWENDVTSVIDYTYNGTTTVTVRNAGDDWNAVFWRTGNLSSTTVAWCTAWMNVYDHLVGFDIEFNDAKPWATSKQSGKYDVQDVATHEVGHNLHLKNLDHITSSDQTMYGTSSMNEDKRRTLATGDSAGAQHILPTDSKPTVTITDPSDQDDVEGTISVTASVTCDDSISNVYFKATTYNGFSCDTGWNAMSQSGGSYTASWNTATHDGEHWILVRAKSTSDIYGYDWIVVDCIGD